MFQYLAKVVEVIDGDTIDAEIDLGFDIIHKIRIRLYGINTPETRTRNKEEKAKGLAAKARLKDLIEGEIVLVETVKDDTEKYGRFLAIIHDKDNININKQLISEGLAEEYFGGKR